MPDPTDIRPEFVVPKLNAAGFEALAEVSAIFNHAANQLDLIFTEISSAPQMLDGIVVTYPNPSASPIGLERALVMTKLQEAMSWARIVIAKDPRVQHVEPSK